MFQTTEFTNRQTDKEKHHSSYLGILHPQVDKKKDNSTKKSMKLVESQVLVIVLAILEAE